MNRSVRTASTVLASIFVAVLLPLRQTGLAQDSDEKTKAEIRQLFAELWTAGSQHDRAALERIFADEYLWIHSSGTIENKARRIENILSAPPPGNTAPDLPSEMFSIYGDVAITRGPNASQYATTVFARKNGRWQFVQGQGTPMPAKRTAVAVDPKTLESFVGRYEFGPGRIGIATNEVGSLWWQDRGVKLRLVPVGTDTFAAEDANLQFTFVKDDKRQVTGLVLRMASCEQSQGTKLK